MSGPRHKGRGPRHSDNHTRGDAGIQDGHKARRRFGQNFLVDTTIIHQIHGAIAARNDQTLVEIGPGLGALTQGLAEQAGRLILVELDRDLGARLQQRFQDQPSVEVVLADALRVDFTELAAGHSLRVVGNLPYNISTPLMFHFFKHAAVISDMTFMLQKEVALRLIAKAGEADYGRLSVMAQFYCHGELVLAVPPEAFNPAPKVHSAIVRLVPHTPPLTDPVAQKRFADIVREAFGQRRKTLRNSLRRLVPDTCFTAAGIDPGARAETLSVDDFVALTREVLAQPQAE